MKNIKKSRPIKIAYINPPNESFISNKISTERLLDLLDKSFNITRLSFDNKYIGLKKAIKNQSDYVLTDLKNFNISQFIIREQYQLNIKFILILRTVWDWRLELISLIPFIKHGDIIISPSYFAKNMFHKISDKIPVHVIPHCLDTKAIEKITSHVKKNTQKKITYMGRLSKDKGIELLIRAMPEIRKRTGNVILNIIGPLSGNNLSNKPISSFVKDMKILIKELSLIKCVFFKGGKTGKAKYELMANSDLFITPTTYIGENFMISNLEALACGIPVITTNWAGNNEQIQKGKNGSLINVNLNKNGKAVLDQKELITKTIEILNNPVLLTKLKTGALKSALKYDVANIMPKISNLLSKNLSTQNQYTNNFNKMQNRLLIDFKDLYSKNMLFYLCLSAAAYKPLKYLISYKQEKLKTNENKKLSQQSSISKTNTSLFKYMFFD